MPGQGVKKKGVNHREYMKCRSGIGGTYPINDGDPQNDCDVDDQYEQDAFEASEEFYNEQK
jgi:hypothetical protein